jgi:hypothetical protein
MPEFDRDVRSHVHDGSNVLRTKNSSERLSCALKLQEKEHTYKKVSRPADNNHVGLVRSIVR